MQASGRDRRPPAEKIELSMHSEGLLDNEDSSEKFFSFNQSFTNIEHNNKLIQEKTNSLSKIKSLEDEMKSCRTRSILWDRARQEMVALNKYLNLSSLSLGCSDSAIMKEFFELVASVLRFKDSRIQDEKSQAGDSKRKENELFEKLVESNKKKYELQQKLVQYEHEVSKLSEVNDSLREKSRAQSTQRSDRIKEFHEETILTFHQQELELTAIEEQRQTLRAEVVQLESQLAAAQKELHQRDVQLEEMKRDREAREREMRENERDGEERAKGRETEAGEKARQQTELQISTIKESLKGLVEENISIRAELARRAELIAELRRVIEEARQANQECMNQQYQLSQEQQSRQYQKVGVLLRAEAELKLQLRSSPRFAVNRHRSLLTSKYSPQNFPSEELLI